MNGLYFAYGSNMSTTRLQARLPHARPVGPGWIEGHQLACNKIGKDGSGKANLMPAARAQAWGVLFEIGPDDWSTLDRYEVGYRRESCDIYTNAGEAVGAQLYLANSPELEDVPPFDWYRDHCLAGAREHALPEATLLVIESWPTVPSKG